MPHDLGKGEGTWLDNVFFILACIHSWEGYRLQCPEYWSIDKNVTLWELLKKSSTPAGILDEIEKETIGRFSDKNLSPPVSAMVMYVRRLWQYIYWININRI